MRKYRYFLVFAEELSISRAADRLFITRQCLSKYLNNLEKEYGTMLFERAPVITLTPAGEAYLEMLREIELLEKNYESKLATLSSATKGTLRFGTTEGRYRILIPSLLSEFKKEYPDVIVDAQYNTTTHLLEQLKENNLDLALMNKRDVDEKRYDTITLLHEDLHLVISDNLLKQFFPDEYPACKQTFKNGVSLKQFVDVPFILSKIGFNSRNVLEKQLQTEGIRLKCVLEITQTDLHFMLAAKDYAACFTWTMYIPMIQRENLDPTLSALNVFPAKGLQNSNEVVLAFPKSKIFPPYAKAFIKLIKKQSVAFASIST